MRACRFQLAAQAVCETNHYSPIANHALRCARGSHHLHHSAATPRNSPSPRSATRPTTPRKRRASPAMIAEMNREALAFVDARGRLQASAHRDCSDALFLQRREWFAAVAPRVRLPAGRQRVDRLPARFGPARPARADWGSCASFSSRRGCTLGQRPLALVRSGSQQGARDYPRAPALGPRATSSSRRSTCPARTTTRGQPEESHAAHCRRCIDWIARGFRIRARAQATSGRAWRCTPTLERPQRPWRGFREVLAALAGRRWLSTGRCCVMHGDTHRYPLRPAPERRRERRRRAQPHPPGSVRLSRS